MQVETDEVFREIRSLLEAHNPKKIEVTPDTDLNADDLMQICSQSLGLVQSKTGRSFPSH